MKKDIKLSRIHCAACASNLEMKIKEVDGVVDASIDFITKTATVEVENKDAKEVLKNVEEAITHFDGSIKIVDTSEEEKEARLEKIHKIADYVKICVCLVLSLVAYLVPIYWLKLTTFIIAYLSISYEVFYLAFKNIIHGRMLDENFLMSIATIGAMALGEFVEAIAVMLFYSVGELLENYAVEKSKKRVKSLMNIKAECANRVTDGKEEIVTLDMVSVGDLILIKAGEKVPLDCVVVEGSSSLSTAVITGESKELFVSSGDELLSGFINGEGVLLCKVTKLEKDSTVTKIIELVEKATKTKAKTEKFITRFARWYTPIVVGAAVLLAVVPWICGASFTTWLYRALTFLVVSCPCALVISIPLGYFAGIGASARRGVLVKGATYLELLSKVKTVVFDKTGTLTHGNFKVAKIYATKKSSKKEVLELIAYAESFSNHRIAKSIVQEYKKTINTAWVEDYKEIAGKGVEATLFGESCLVGNAQLLKDRNIDFEETDESATVVYLVKNGEYLGYVLVEDEIKADAKDAIEKLRGVGIKNISMFTGDNELVASKVAEKLSLDSYYSSLMPAGKVECLKKLQEGGDKLAFVGDGINDAPVLASVDVGISMGGVGSDVAIETSDVVLMTDQPSKVVDAIKISKKTNKIICENIVGILLIKIVVLILSAIGISGMWLAIFADVGVCVLAILNSLRAMIYPKDKEERKKRDKNKK